MPGVGQQPVKPYQGVGGAGVMKGGPKYGPHKGIQEYGLPTGSGKAPPVQTAQATTPTATATYSMPNTAAPVTQQAAPPPQTTTTNTVRPDPRMNQFLGMFQQRYNQLQDSKSNTEDTARRTDQAFTQISDAAEGQRARAEEDAARRGVAGTGVQDAMERTIDNNTQRLQAGAAANIQMDAARRQDEADLVREGNRSNFLLGGAGSFAEVGRQQLAGQGLNQQAYNSLASQGLQQQSLSLQQQQMQQAERDRQNQMWLALAGQFGGGR